MANERQKMGKLTPMDIHNQEFKHRGRKGYDRYEVDHFLDRIVDDYGDVLDQMVDLKNENAALQAESNKLKEQNQTLQRQVNDLEKQKTEVNQVMVAAQKSANQAKADAKRQADQILSKAKQEIAAEKSYANQQVDVLSKDYKRLKEQVGQFRSHMQELLKREVANLNDDEWQTALDKYFHTQRFYPGDGSQPITVSKRTDLAKLRDADEAEDADDELSDIKAKFLNRADADQPDQIDPADLAAADEDDADDDASVDKDQVNEVDSSKAPTAKEAKKQPKPMTGDSPSHETINVKPQSTQTLGNGPTIIFPDNYKDHH